MGANQIALELDEFSFHQRNQVFLDMSGVVAFHHKNVLVVVLVVEELVQSDGAGEGAVLLVLLGTQHGKSKLHIVNTQSLALSLGDITVARNSSDFSDNKLQCIVFVGSVDDVVTKIFLRPRKTVSVDPVPGVSFLLKVKRSVFRKHTSC